MTGAVAKRSQYNRDAVLSASPVRLLTMLYDRLLLDLTRGETALLAQKWPVAWENLRHADQIISELASTLKLDVWEGADGLLALYTYTSNTIVTANIDRDPALVREAIELLEPLRQTWHEAAETLPVAGLQGAPDAGRFGGGAAGAGVGAGAGAGAGFSSGSGTGEARELGIA